MFTDSNRFHKFLAKKSTHSERCILGLPDFFHAPFNPTLFESQNFQLMTFYSKTEIFGTNCQLAGLTAGSRLNFSFLNLQNFGSHLQIQSAIKPSAKNSDFPCHGQKPPNIYPHFSALYFGMKENSPGNFRVFRFTLKFL